MLSPGKGNPGRSPWCGSAPHNYRSQLLVFLDIFRKLFPGPTTDLLTLLPERRESLRNWECQDLNVF